MQRRAPAVEPRGPHEAFVEAGLPKGIVALWLSAWPETSDDFKHDGQAFARFGTLGADLRGLLFWFTPPKANSAR
jgi:hypothetical protein